MSDTVRRIDNCAFDCCYSLGYIKLSRNLEFIGSDVFYGCISLTSIFIPPSCREIGSVAFRYCKKLVIFGLPQNVELGTGVFQNTELIKKSPIETNINLVNTIEAMREGQSNGSSPSTMKKHTLFTALAPLSIQ